MSLVELHCGTVLGDSISCVEQEFKLRGSDIPGVELPKAPEYCIMPILKG